MLCRTGASMMRWCAAAILACTAAGAAQENGPAVIEAERLVALLQAIDAPSHRPPSIFAGVDLRRASLDTRQVARTIAVTRLSVSFKNARLEDVLAHLRATTGLNFILSAGAREALRTDTGRVDLQVQSLALEDILALIVLQLREYRFTFKHGAILVVRAAEYRPPTVLRVYNVRDLTMPRRDFPGPRVGAGPADNGNGFR